MFLPGLAGPDTGRLLVLGTSYYTALVPYHAQNYAYTQHQMIFHPLNYDADARLEEMVRTGEYDDVVIVANPTAIVDFVKECPDFLKAIE